MMNCKIGMMVFGLAALQAGSTLAAEDGDWRQGREIFARCASCHSFTEGQHRFGPSLHGVFDRKAGTIPGYPFSEGMLAKGAAGLVWTAETLDAFLTKPGAFIPKTKMNFPGLPDAQDRANVIAYVKRRAAK